MTLNSNLPVSLQYQLKSILLEKIQSGEWASGQMIPSERELCDEYSVSRITVREVLGSLTKSGFLVRKQGKGTFVAEEKIEYSMTSNYSLSRELKKKGVDDRFLMLGFDAEVADDFYKQLFGLSTGESVSVINRLRIINGRKYAWEKSVVPTRYLAGATSGDISDNGLYNSIKSCSGFFPEDVDDIIEAVNCPDQIASQLELQRGAAVIRVTRTTHSQGRTIEYCISYLNGQRYMCKHEIHR